MYIQRLLEQEIEKYLSKNEIIAITGPKQAGKTTLLLHLKDKQKNSIYLSFDDIETKELFDRSIKEFINMYINPYTYIFIDEFQYSKEGGKNLKFIFDTFIEKGIFKKIIVSGSSSIDLLIRAVKYLVGRIFVFTLYPLSFGEFLDFKNKPIYEETIRHKNENWKNIKDIFLNMIKPYFIEYLQYGGYPRVSLSSNNEEKVTVLKNIYNTFLLKDVKELIEISDDYKMLSLIKSLSVQIGNIISYQELSNTINVSFETLKRYLNFLEKTYIIQKITPFYRNKRTELVKNPKIYFCDLGLRNAVINDFRALDSRVDKGFLLENFHFLEFIKKGIIPKFWRTKSKAEVDFIIEEYEKVIPVEVKSNILKKDGKVKMSLSFQSFIEKYKPIKSIIYNDEYLSKKNNIEYLPHWLNI